ncbi:MAG: PspC domain-containing protein [bacterium]
MAISKSRTLYRSEKNRMIAGVAAGLAEYFDIDPVIVRLIFVFMVVYGGSGVLIYVILWLVIPSESDVKKPTEETVQKGANEIKDKAENLAESIKDHGSNRIYLGIFLLVLGLAFLFNNFGFFNILHVWRFWPLIIVGVGISLLLKSDGK